MDYSRNEEKIMISIIMPHYKHHAYILDAILSILNQSYQDWELLIMNDDEVVLPNYSIIDKRIRWWHDGQNKGQPHRLNRGVRLSSGDYIAFMDADDIMTPYRLAESLKCLIINDYDMVYGNLIRVYKDGERRYCKTPKYYNGLFRKMGGLGFDTILIRSKFAKEVRFDESIGYGNDWIWYVKLVQKFPNIKIGKLDLPLIYVRDYTSTFRRKLRMKVKKALLRKKVKGMFDSGFKE